MKRLKHNQHRRQSGNMVVLALMIAVFAVLPLSLLGFEMSRFFLIQMELQHCLDAAALSGTAALASSPSGYTVTGQQQIAMQAAVNNFEQNSVLQTNFNTSNVEANQNTTPDLSNPPVFHATLNITLLDQNGNQQPTGSLTATTMRIQGAYTDQPTFFNSALTPLGNAFTARAYATGGLPMLDLALCFDISGSMDDQTVVAFVNRYWDGTKKQVHYQIVQQGQSIYNACLPAETGTSLNATRPQNLSFAAYPAPSNQTTYIFSEGAYPSPNSLIGLRANASTAYPSGPLCPEQGKPPGNYNSSTPTATVANGINPLAYANGFTDMVAVPTGYTVQSAVEASRGNLNSQALLLQSQGGAISSELTGYTVSTTAYTDYWTAVNNMAAPMASARTAAVNFFNLMNTSSNAHFMLETFATGQGTSATGTYVDTANNPNNYNADGNYAGAGTGTFPLPLISLSQTDPMYTQVIAAIQGTASTPANPLNATGKTDIADALQTALSQLTNTTLARPTAKKAIILFTDGIPNMPTDQTTGTNAAYAQATAAKNAGIPIYTIGLSTNSAIINEEAQVLGDNTNNSGPGIAYLSGNNATYTSVTNAANLETAFQTIARALVVLQ